MIQEQDLRVCLKRAATAHQEYDIRAKHYHGLVECRLNSDTHVHTGTISRVAFAKLREEQEEEAKVVLDFGRQSRLFTATAVKGWICIDRGNGDDEPIVEILKKEEFDFTMPEPFPVRDIQQPESMPEIPNSHLIPDQPQSLERRETYWIEYSKIFGMSPVSRKRCSSQVRNLYKLRTPRTTSKICHKRKAVDGIEHSIEPAKNFAAHKAPNDTLAMLATRGGEEQIQNQERSGSEHAPADQQLPGPPPSALSRPLQDRISNAEARDIIDLTDDTVEIKQETFDEADSRVSVRRAVEEEQAEEDLELELREIHIYPKETESFAEE
ncbi:hypothetical protein AC579_9187 [Pseudocercospora musae]|uniref:Uncharacterized protein n=1 Tax=Pseudocercospora musae TaxID=113226 RepID=A0A139HAU3_9PEZI|nr:hypothetical protein AC579_9187 [Pseudocercospora musae]